MIGYLLRLRFGAAVWRQVRNCKPDPLVLAGEPDDVCDWFSGGRIAASVLCRATTETEAFSLIGTPSGDLAWLPSAVLAATEVVDTEEVVDFAAAVGSLTQVHWQPAVVRDDTEWVHVDSQDDWVYFQRWDSAGQRGVGPLCSASASAVLAKIPLESQPDLHRNERSAVARPLELCPDDGVVEEQLLARFMHSCLGKYWALHPFLAADSLSVIRGLATDIRCPSTDDATNGDGPLWPEPPETGIDVEGQTPALGDAAEGQSPERVVAADRQTRASGVVAEGQSPETVVVANRPSPAIEANRPSPASVVATEGQSPASDVAVELPPVRNGTSSGETAIPLVGRDVVNDAPVVSTTAAPVSPNAFDHAATHAPSESGMVGQAYASTSRPVAGDHLVSLELSQAERPKLPHDALAAQRTDVSDGSRDRAPRREPGGADDPPPKLVLAAAVVHAHPVAPSSEMPHQVQTIAATREEPHGQESSHRGAQNPLPRTVANGDPRTSGTNLGIPAILPQELAALPHSPPSAHQQPMGRRNVDALPASRPAQAHEPTAQRELTRSAGHAPPAAARGQAPERTHAVIDGDTIGAPKRLRSGSSPLAPSDRVGQEPDASPVEPTGTSARRGEPPIEPPSRLGTVTSARRGEPLVEPPRTNDGSPDAIGRAPLRDVHNNHVAAEPPRDRNDMQPLGSPPVALPSLSRLPSRERPTASQSPTRRILRGTPDHTPVTRGDPIPPSGGAATIEGYASRDGVLTGGLRPPIARILGNAEHRSAGFASTTTVSPRPQLAMPHPIPTAIAVGHSVAAPASGVANVLRPRADTSVNRRGLAQKIPTVRDPRVPTFTVSRGFEIGEVIVEIGLGESRDSHEVPMATGSLIAAIPHGRIGGRR